MSNSCLLKKYKPFFSLKFCRIMGIIIIAVTLLPISSALSNYFFDPKNEDLLTNATLYENLRNVSKMAIPIIIYQVFIRLKQGEKNRVIIIFTYVTFALLFYVGEIILYNSIIYPLLEIVGEKLAGNESLLNTLIVEFTYSSLEHMSNFNFFIDYLMCSLFFVLVNADLTKASKRKKIVNKIHLSLTVAFVVITFILNCLSHFKVVHFDIYVQALFVARPISVYLFFFGLVIFNKYRKKLYAKRHNGVDDGFAEYVKSREGIRNFAVSATLFLIFITLINFALSSFVPKASYFGIKNSYYIGLSAPLLLLVDVEKRERFKWTIIFEKIAFVIVMVLIYSVYAYIFITALNALLMM